MHADWRQEKAEGDAQRQEHITRDVEGFGLREQSETERDEKKRIIVKS